MMDQAFSFHSELYSTLMLYGIVCPYRFPEMTVLH